MPNMQFRCVEESEGGTLPLYDLEIPRLGTYFLMTCVGVYFKVDKDRCFFAHMSGATPEIRNYWSVTERAGEEIGSQVKDRLCNFLRVDNWDIRDSEFGKDLLLQCPCLQDRSCDGKSYYTPGKFVVKALQEFFVACAQFLEEEAAERRAAPQASQVEHYRRETWRLMLKSTFLRRIGTTTEVNSEHHIMIISPLTGVTWRFGKVRPPRTIEEADLEKHVPVSLELEEGICGFGVMEDDRTALPERYLTTDEERAKTLRVIQWDRQECESFGSGIENAVSSRLSTLLKETHLQAVPDEHPLLMA